jgi:hypothetical protein
MSTAIATTGKFAGLAVRGGEFRKSDLTFVSVPPKGATKWTWSTVLGDKVESEIVGVIVALSEPQHDLWPRQGEATEKSSAYMRSLDARSIRGAGVVGTAKIVGDDPGDLDLGMIKKARIGDTDEYDIAKIEYFQWKKDGERNIPPRANTTSVIGVLRPGDSAPVFVRLSKTSSPVVQEFVRKLRGQGVEPYQVVVSLGLEAIKGGKATYSRVVPKFVSPAPAEMVETFAAYFDETSPKLRGSLEKYTGSRSDAVPF